MGLPELIEIVPLDQPVRAEITVPGSKSITNRALILAALADGETVLRGALWSEDTQIMVECLQELGFMVNVEPDPDEPCNRTITVYGNGGAVPPGSTESQPMELFVGNAGTAARFLAAFVCLGKGVYRLSGVPRMHERPQAALFQALRELGYRVESENGNDKLPVVIHGKDAVSAPQNISGKVRDGDTPSVPKKCRVSIEESSQFASALLLCAKVGSWKIEIVGENAEESPYVAMTSKLMEVFPKSGGMFQIEPDASSGSYFWAAGWLFPVVEDSGGGISIFDLSLYLTGRISKPKYFSVRVLHWPKSSWQIDQHFPALLPKPPDFMENTSRARDLGDSIMTAIVLAPFSNQLVRFTDLGRLRVQECERVKALETELKRCGVKAHDYGVGISIDDDGGLLVTEDGKIITDESFDTLEIQPANVDELHGAVIETYHDHRMAMCFAILGLKVPGIKIKNPACVKKTFPNFFQKLAAPPPHGLGAEIWEIKNGQRTRKLSGEDLFAD
jgi:3-phosphoshikimate 1-carboxyvinyltransferase